MDTKQLKIKARALSPAIRIGKNGLTPEVIKEISRQLKKKGLIKIKMLPPMLEGKDKSFKKSAAKEIAAKTNSELLDLTGFVIVLCMRKKKEESQQQ